MGEQSVKYECAVNVGDIVAVDMHVHLEVDNHAWRHHGSVL